MAAQVKTDKVTEELVRGLLDIFVGFDSDGDKKLNRAEFVEFLKKSDLDPATADLAFAVFDKDKSGKLDFEEFVEFALFETISESRPRTYFKRVFEAFDADKSGKLDAGELGKFLKTAQVQNADALATSIISKTGGQPLDFNKLVEVLQIPADQA
jgi:Ca2+-binding EF-hand superfamily protein